MSAPWLSLLAVPTLAGATSLFFLRQCIYFFSLSLSPLSPFSSSPLSCCGCYSRAMLVLLATSAFTSVDSRLAEMGRSCCGCTGCNSSSCLRFIICCTDKIQMSACLTRVRSREHDNSAARSKLLRHTRCGAPQRAFRTKTCLQSPSAAPCSIFPLKTLPEARDDSQPSPLQNTLPRARDASQPIILHLAKHSQSASNMIPKNTPLSKGLATSAAPSCPYIAVGSL